MLLCDSSLWSLFVVADKLTAVVFNSLSIIIVAVIQKTTLSMVKVDVLTFIVMRNKLSILLVYIFNNDSDCILIAPCPRQDTLSTASTASTVTSGQLITLKAIARI
jgi:hypothetical protein